MSSQSTGYDIGIGSIEEARAMIGTRTPVRFGGVDVDSGMVHHFAAMVHDGSAAYWDEDYAGANWGALLSPPALLMTWVMPFEWEPAGATPVPLLTARVPLPGNTFVNASNDTEYFAPIKVGDRLNVVEELADVSDEKDTSLGRGHFVTTISTYRRQDGRIVARSTNVLFRFDGDAPDGEGAGGGTAG